LIIPFGLWLGAGGRQSGTILRLLFPASGLF